MIVHAGKSVHPFEMIAPQAFFLPTCPLQSSATKLERNMSKIDESLSDEFVYVSSLFTWQSHQVGPLGVHHLG